MNTHIEKHKVEELRELYQVSGAAKKILDWAAGRTNDAAETNLERIISVTSVSRGEAVEFGRRIDDIGCGQFVVGRRGAKSRVHWLYSLKSLGKAAQGQADTLADVDPEVVEDALDQQGLVGADTTSESETALTIPEAKKRLALAFGVLADAIEITIRG